MRNFLTPRFYPEVWFYLEKKHLKNEGKPEESRRKPMVFTHKKQEKTGKNRKKQENNGKKNRNKPEKKTGKKRKKQEKTGKNTGKHRKKPEKTRKKNRKKKEKTGKNRKKPEKNGKKNRKKPEKTGKKPLLFSFCQKSQVEPVRLWRLHDGLRVHALLQGLRALQAGARQVLWWLFTESAFLWLFVAFWFYYLRLFVAFLWLFCGYCGFSVATEAFCGYLFFGGFI